MDDFNTIRLKKKVIEKFKEYSKNTSPSYSETLDYMIAFFEDTGLSLMIPCTILFYHIQGL